MRVTHAAFMAHYEPGVLQQMEWENAAAFELGLSWKARLFVPADSGYPDTETVVGDADSAGKGSFSLVGRLGRWARLRRNYYRWLAQEVRECDVLLLRHSVSDPFQYFFLRQVKKPVFSVHHTMEVPELRGNGGLTSRIRTSAEAIFGSASIKHVSGLVGVTKEIAEYELKRARLEKISLVYPNGIFSKGCLARFRKSEVINIAFVASNFLPWHGLDLLLSDLPRTSENFVLHVIGRVGARDLSVASLDRRVVLHGLLNSADLLHVLEGCDVGLASFALNRKGMKEACTLKVREYLAAGVPVYSGHRDVFPSDFVYYKEGPPTFAEILKFVRQVRAAPRVKIAQEAAEFIQKERLLRRFYGELERSVNQL